MKRKLSFTVFLFLSSSCFADVAFDNGSWSTTFDCGETTITSPGTGICDGLNITDVYAADGTHNTQITTDADHPAGGGTRGYRHWIGTTRNDQSSAFIAVFPSGQSELWVRWYARYQGGFTWSGIHAHKVLYFAGSGAWFYLLYPHFRTSQGALDTIGYAINGLGDYQSLSNGWESTQGGETASGRWDCYETYVKINSAAGTPDGVFRIWINGALVNNHTSVDMLSGAGGGGGLLTRVTIGSNHDTASNPAPYYEDFDDIAIATPAFSGFVQDAQGNHMIGPLERTPPRAPTGLTIQD